MNFNNVLKSKYLYYAAVALMVINVMGYVSLGSIECVLVLGGAAYLANQFTDNRTVDIFIGLFVSNILFGCGRLREGLENATDAVERTAATLTEEGKTEGDADKVHTGVAVQQAAKKCGAECKKKKAAAAREQGLLN